MRTILCAAVAVAALLPAAAMANGRTQTGTTSDGRTWTAQSYIVGQTSTGIAPPVGGGNPIYLANDPRYSGVVGLLMTYEGGDQFVCSGSLTGGNRIVTAAHCISNGYASNVNGKAADLVRTQAFFYDGTSSGVDPQYYADPSEAGVTAIDVTTYHTNAGYTGEVIDQNDIAVLQLGQAAPDYATVYGLYTDDILGETFNVAGLGARSTVGGAVGANAGTGRRRQGDNTYDVRLGEFYSGVGSNCGPNRDQPCTAAFEYSYLSDFDNGLPQNDAHCLFFGRCTAFQGLKEVSIAGGDSGGPGFIGGKLASVNSYGLTFGRFCLNRACTITGPDVDDELNSSWGESNGFVPIFIHTNWIGSVPEPSTWALLILGFGLTGAAMRRKSKVQARYAF